MVDELLVGQVPVKPKRAKTTAHHRPSSSKIDVLANATTAGDQMAQVGNLLKGPVEETTSSTKGMEDRCCSNPYPFEMYQQTVYGHPGIVNKDHSYAPMTPNIGTVQRPPLPTTAPTVITETDQSVTAHPIETDDTDDDICDMECLPTKKSDSDPDYSPSSSDSDESEDMSDCEEEEPLSKHVTYLVFDVSLRNLMKRCQECGKPVICKEKHETGTLVTYKLSCLDGHIVTWRSQPVVRKTALGNLMLSAAILFSGLTYARFEAAAKAMNLAIFAKDTFNVIQRTKLFPVIQEAWKKLTSQLISERTGHVCLSMDCRCDSPGHNAKYGTYSAMETSEGPNGTDKILNIQLVQCTEVKNSNAMEPEGLRRGLKDLKSSGLKINTVVTDRHVQVRKIMATEFTDIDHQFDIWHVCKSVVKKLNAKAARKENVDLLPWIQCVSNHLWWCCATCNGDEQELRERWISILNHVTNKHHWRGNLKFKKCGHSRMTAAQSKKKAWLKPNSSSFEALQEVVMDPYLLKTLPHLVKFRHTGQLEVFHSMLLKYCPKRQHFGYKGMTARSMLAGLDWNTRECQPVLNADGSERVDLVFSKRRKMWVLRQRYRRSSGRHIPGLMARMLEVHRDKIQLPPIVSPVLPANISRTDKPNKAKAVAERRTRFKKK